MVVEQHCSLAATRCYICVAAAELKNQYEKSARKREPPLMATRSTPPAATTPNYTGPFITVTILYFIFGFITKNYALHLSAIVL